jgi:hypothetical protein
MKKDIKGVGEIGLAASAIPTAQHGLMRQGNLQI